MPAKALVGEAGDGMDDEAERAGQGHGALVAEAECSGSLALMVERLVDALEERRADGTALTGTLDHKQTIVDLASLGHELRQVLQAPLDADVGGVVDDGLDTQGPPFFQILLDAAVLVGEVHVNLGAGSEDPFPIGGLVGRRSGRANTMATRSGRPVAMLSVTSDSKNALARRGRRRRGCG
jgi:hypothetical protein